MKKIICALLIVLAFASIACAASDWDSTVASIGNRIKIKEEGAKVLRSFANLKATEKEEFALWQKLWTQKGEQRKIAAMSLVNSLFPDGNPAKWEQVSGLTGVDFRCPRQLMAMDALFAAVDELSANDDTIWGAALLLEQFGESGYGKLMFVEQSPAGVKQIIDKVIAKTTLAGDWSVKRVRGKLPYLPRYEGRKSHSNAESMGLVYLDNFGSLANYGEYGWDRDKGLLYEIYEDNGGHGGRGGRL